MERITVALGDRSYPITIASGALKHFSSFWPLNAGEQVMLVTNKTLEPLYMQPLLKLFRNSNVKTDYIILPDGEEYKSLEKMNEIFTVLLKKNHDRNTTIIALGGGVIGDLTGFVAACYQRGVRLIQVPTTLLAQVDASIGGKTAVNHPLAKNMIGAFYQPLSVIIDIDCLLTLPKRELSSGLAEIIKYSIIFDISFFEWLEKNLDDILILNKKKLSYCIRRCCEIKAQIVTTDEKENGIRTLLNLGHTFGHAIETYMGYGNWSHGEAVSAGIVMAANLAEYLNNFSAEDTQRIIHLLKRANLPTFGPKKMKAESYIPYIIRDKKILSSKLRFVLPVRIGCAKIHQDVPQDIVLKAINKTNNYSRLSS